MAITVELKPHIGQQQDGLQVVNIEHDQWMVYAHSPEDFHPAKTLFIGYLPKAKGRPFLPYTSFAALSEPTRQEIYSAINKVAGDVRPVGNIPLPIESLNAKIDPDSDDDEDSDEDEDNDE